MSLLSGRNKPKNQIIETQSENDLNDGKNGYF
jgi:hypothetical protein